MHRDVNAGKGISLRPTHKHTDVFGVGRFLQ